jgi:hypothetical protein
MSIKFFCLLMLLGVGGHAMADTDVWEGLVLPITGIPVQDPFDYFGPYASDTYDMAALADIIKPGAKDTFILRRM